MDSVDQKFDSLVAGQFDRTPDRHTLLALRDAVLVLLALAAVAGLFGICGWAARVGWNMAGGVGW